MLRKITRCTYTLLTVATYQQNLCTLKGERKQSPNKLMSVAIYDYFLFKWHLYDLVNITEIYIKLTA